MPVRVNVCHDLKLINRNVFLAIPIIILGICLNECMILGRNKDWTGLIVTVLTLLSCFIYFTTFRVRNNCRPQCFLAAFAIIGLSILAAIVFLTIILTETDFGSHPVLQRPFPSVNGTECDGSEESTNGTSFSCGVWLQEVKSSWSLCTSNVALLINSVLSFIY